ncbi:MAG: GGDEF domain-containing protein [Pseudomonadota bacterium]
MTIQDARPPRRMAREKSTGAADLDAQILEQIPEDSIPVRLRDALMSKLGETEQLRTALAEANARIAELEEIADRDPLLNILNRRAFLREVERALAIVKRYRLQASLVYIDIDNLKDVNDQQGHAAGDAVIMGIAKTISDNIRHEDSVGRLGGDEFGVLLTDADPKTARATARRLAQKIAANAAPKGADPVGATISYGIAALEVDARLEQILERADKEMYQAKRERG